MHIRPGAGRLQNNSRAESLINLHSSARVCRRPAAEMPAVQVWPADNKPTIDGTLSSLSSAALETPKAAAVAASDAPTPSRPNKTGSVAASIVVGAELGASLKKSAPLKSFQTEPACARAALVGFGPGERAIYIAGRINGSARQCRRARRLLSFATRKRRQVGGGEPANESTNVRLCKCWHRQQQRQLQPLVRMARSARTRTASVLVWSCLGSARLGSAGMGWSVLGIQHTLS